MKTIEIVEQKLIQTIEIVNQWQLMISEVLEDFLAAPDSSRPAGSIGEVKFNIRIDYTSQKPPQSINFLHDPGR